MKSDAQIQDDVTQELKWDPSIHHELIGVSVHNGIVTLAGSVPSYFEKWAAEKATQTVSGVKAIVEKIEVNIPGSLARNDQDIARAITEQYRWNFQVPDKLIHIQVENGWVKISGEVEWDFQRKAAENCISSLNGIKGIANHIQLKSKKILSETIKHRIEESLKRKAERQASHITVEVDDQKVTLSGKVNTFSEMYDARGAALSTPGVISVQNNIMIGN